MHMPIYELFFRKYIQSEGKSVKFKKNQDLEIYGFEISNIYFWKISNVFVLYNICGIFPSTKLFT